MSVSEIGDVCPRHGSKSSPPQAESAECSTSSRTRARSTDGELSLGGIPAHRARPRARQPARRLLTRQTLRAAARAYREAAPDALVVYGTKAFPNVALLRLFAEEGLGADVSTLGELALRAGGRASPASALVVHGNNKSDEELARPPRLRARSSCSTRSRRSSARARPASRRALVRVTPGIEADTHEAIRTGHHGSKFGLPPDDALEALARARPDSSRAACTSTSARSCSTSAPRGRPSTGSPPSPPARRDELGWTPQLVDLGGGLGVATSPDEPELDDRASSSAALARRARPRLGAPRPAPPARDPRAGPLARRRAPASRSTRVGAVKRASETTTYVAVDGGMSDNPRPALYGARYTALLANRAGRAAGRRLRGRRQALRVGRRADRRASSCRSRAAATSSPSRRPAPTRSR